MTHDSNCEPDELDSIPAERFQEAKQFVLEWFENPRNYNVIEEGGVGDVDQLIVGIASRLGTYREVHRASDSQSADEQAMRVRVNCGLLQPPFPPR